MSKTDATGAQSLEEILAQIKKSVAGEPGTAGTDVAVGPGLETGSRPADGGLSARLAGVLQETGRGTSADDDYSDLLAAEGEKPAQVALTDPVAPTRTHAQSLDPLWFLRPPSEAAPEDGASAPTRPDAGAASMGEEIKLSRPQELRASLPPLFGAENEQLPVTRMPAVSAAEAPPNPPQAATPAETLPPDNILTAKTRPLMPAPEASGASPDDADVRGLEVAADLATPPTIPAHPQAAANPASATIPAPPQDPSGTPTPAADVSRARTLEHVIGELLEPVIRQWLEANLPRLVEEVVRKEVVRAVAAERPTI
jgi:cell pole-organizing protein PopZ